MLQWCIGFCSHCIPRVFIIIIFSRVRDHYFGRVGQLLLTISGVSVDDSVLTDDISSLSDSFCLIFLPPVFGRIFACIGLDDVPTLVVTEVVNPLLFLSELGPLPPDGGGPLLPCGGTLPPGGGSSLVLGL
jgi:hypothetical protein